MGDLVSQLRRASSPARHSHWTGTCSRNSCIIVFPQHRWLFIEHLLCAKFWARSGQKRPDPSLVELRGRCNRQAVHQGLALRLTIEGDGKILGHPWDWEKLEKAVWRWAEPSPLWACSLPFKKGDTLPVSELRDMKWDRPRTAQHRVCPTVASEWHYFLWIVIPDISLPTI